jgi:hypothetical protein
MKNWRFTAVYQLFYGLAGVLFNGYLLLLSLNSSQGAQAFLAICLFIGFSMAVFGAGLARHKRWKGNLLASLLVQAIQVASINVSDLHLHLRCGTSVNLKYEQGIFTGDLDVTDVASALSWKMPPDSYGVNLFALLICVVLVAESTGRRPEAKAFAHKPSVPLADRSST